MYTVKPVPSSIECSSPFSGLDDIRRIEFLAISDISFDSCRFSITKLGPRCYSLVDFGDAHQKDKHYTSWSHAFSGLKALTKRRLGSDCRFEPFCGK